MDLKSLLNGLELLLSEPKALDMLVPFQKLKEIDPLDVLEVLFLSGFFLDHLILPTFYHLLPKSSDPLVVVVKKVRNTGVFKFIDPVLVLLDL